MNTGDVKALTNGEYAVVDIERIDASNDHVWFSATGRESGRNPYHVYLYLTKLDGAKPILLTPEDAHHDVRMSSDADWFVDSYSAANLAPVTILRYSDDGRVAMELTKADIFNLTETGWSSPEVFVIKAADGETDIYGAIYKPINFDPSKSYPIIDFSYTGPHTFQFPNAFRRTLSSTIHTIIQIRLVGIASNVVSIVIEMSRTSHKVIK